MNATRKLPRPPMSPPAVWTAFATQARWKNWVLLGQQLLIALLVYACIVFARTTPDVVVVAEDGLGTWVDGRTSPRALDDFLKEQRNRPSELTLLAFTQRFIRLAAGVNSTTIDQAWPEALSMMNAGLAAKLKADAESSKLIETYQLAQIRTVLAFDAVELVERVGQKSHVRATVSRTRQKLVSGSTPATEDIIQVDLILVEVPRSRIHPDGLEVLDWRSSPAPKPSPRDEANGAQP